MSRSIRSTWARSAVNSAGGGPAEANRVAAACSPPRRRDHDRHRELAHRGAHRHGMPEPPDPVVAADDQHRRVRPARFQPPGHAALDVEVTLTRPPGRQRLLQRGRRVRAQLPQVLLLGGGQGEPQLDQLPAGVHANAGCPWAASRARVRAGEVLRGADERVRVVPGHGDQIGEAVPARLILLAHPVGFHLRGHQRRPGGRGHHPDQVGLGGPVHRRGHRPVAHATPAGAVSTTPARSPRAVSQRSSRSRAASARATLRGECSAIPNKVL